MARTVGPPKILTSPLWAFLIATVVITATWYMVIYYKACINRKEHSQTLITMLHTVAEVLEKEGAIYWLDFGTLLGAVRHKGLIPWDSDIDIGMFEQDVPSLLRYESYFNSLGWQLEPKKIGWRVFTHSIRTYTPSVYIDIYVYHPSSTPGIYNRVNSTTHTMNVAYYLSPPGRVEFEGRSLMAPSHVEEFLEARFGPDWRIPQRPKPEWRNTPRQIRNLLCYAPSHIFTASLLCAILLELIVLFLYKVIVVGYLWCLKQRMIAAQKEKHYDK